MLAAMCIVSPALYQAPPGSFKDLTTGSVAGTAGETFGCCGTPTFEAKKGWDPASGLGTPSFGVLLDYLVGL